MIDYQKIITNIKSDPYIKQFVDDNGISEEYLNGHLSPFLDCLASLDICKLCCGFDACKQAKKGEIVTLKYDGEVYNDITYCKKYFEKKHDDLIKANYIYSDIPSEYKNLTLNNIEIVDNNILSLLAKVNDIAQGNTNKGLYINGDLGVGKTYMCIALANTLAKNNKKVAFIKTNYFINKMRQLIINDTYTYDSIINSIKEVPYLIVDDIGSESVSAYSRDDLLFNILDYRMEHKLTTIFTSNLSKEELLDHYTYDKNTTSKVRAKRLLERIDLLSEDYVLKGDNKRRSL